MAEAEIAGVADVLAVTGPPDTAVPVAATAAAFARLTGGDVRELRLAAGLSPEQAARLVLRALDRPGTVCGVLAGGGPSRAVWLPVARQAAKPVVLVPAGLSGQPPRLRRVLLPLDGTAGSAAAVAAAAERFALGGAELVVLHVFGPEMVPMFWDQHAHADREWTREFLARYCVVPGARLELRVGIAAEHVIQVAGAERADVIALAWSQRLEPGRAPVVRRAVLDAQVPVMLIPVAPD
jgi:hypothetical protein